MSTKNNKGGITYKHIPQAGKTIATLEGCGDNLENILWKLVINNSRFLGFIGCNAEECKKSMIMRDRYNGVAKVNTADGDVYSEEEGKNVAYEKVMNSIVTWIRRLGAAVALFGGVMLALGFKDNDADSKEKGIKTMIAGFVVWAICTGITMFDLFS